MESYEKERLLLERKFPDYRRLREPYSGTDPERLARIADFQAYVTRLNQMSPKELDELCIEGFRQKNLEREEAAHRSDQLAYFSQPDAEADFNFWSRSKTWTIDEAAALLLGKDPHKVRWEDLITLRFESIFVAQYRKLREQMLRAIRDGQLTDGDDPRKYIEWASETAFVLPSQLEVLRGYPLSNSSLAWRSRNTDMFQENAVVSRNRLPKISIASDSKSPTTGFARFCKRQRNLSI